MGMSWRWIIDVKIKKIEDKKGEKRNNKRIWED